MRHVIRDLLFFFRNESQSDALDGGFEQDSGGGAVYVVVAVNEDRFRILDGCQDARDGRGHTQHLCGIGGWVIEEFGEAGIEECFCCGRRCNAARDEDPCYGKRA